MNYKNNLITKKKYKIVNQKAGAEYNLTLCVHWTDYFPNMFGEFITPVPLPLNIKIVQNSWNHGEGVLASIVKKLQTRNFYSISNAAGKIVNLKMDEDNFINFLLNPKVKFNRIGLDPDTQYTPEPTQLQPISFNDLGFDKKINYNLCILYHIAFFECIPPQFEQLYLQILEKIKEGFKIFYKTIVHSLKVKKVESKKNRIIFPEIYTKIEVSLEEEKLYNLTRPESEFMKKIKECDTKIKEYDSKISRPTSGTLCSPPIDNSCTVQKNKVYEDFITKKEEAQKAYEAHEAQKKAQEAQEAQEAREAQSLRRGKIRGS